MAYVLLGIGHLASHISKSGLSENVLQTLNLMQRTKFDFMGQHDLMQFYTGFSIVMGAMLIAFRLQSLLIKQPSKPVIILNILVSLLIFVPAVMYFHPVAYCFNAFSMICFTLALYQFAKSPNNV